MIVTAGKGIWNEIDLELGDFWWIFSHIFDTFHVSSEWNCHWGVDQLCVHIAQQKSTNNQRNHERNQPEDSLNQVKVFERSMAQTVDGTFFHVMVKVFQWFCSTFYDFFSGLTCLNRMYFCVWPFQNPHRRFYHKVENQFENRQEWKSSKQTWKLKCNWK